MRSTATTVQEYLAELPPDRRAALEAVRQTILENLPAGRETFEAAYEATRKRMDLGKSCVRFKKLDDLPLELIGESIQKFGVDEFVERVEEAHMARKGRGLHRREAQ